MKTQLRAAAIATAGAAFLAPLVMMAGPASAATTYPFSSITQANCDSVQGTFSRAKGVKMCARSVVRVDGPFTDSKLVLAASFPPSDISLPGAGYFGEWKQTDTYLDVVVDTQKGKGSVATNTLSSTLTSRTISDEFCGTSTDGFTIGFALIVECQVAGVYPAQF